MLSSSVVRDTRNLCTSGFSAVCVGKSIVSNRCFFVDLLVVDDPPPPPQTSSSPHHLSENTSVTINTTTTSTPPPSLPVAKRIHMVGDQVMSSAPKTIEGILSTHGASIEALSRDLIKRYMLARNNNIGSEDEDEVANAILVYEKLRSEQQQQQKDKVVDAESSSVSSHPADDEQPLVNMRLFSLCFAAGGRGTSDDHAINVVDGGDTKPQTTTTTGGGLHQLSTPEFIHQVSSLFYTAEEVAECLSQASSVTGESAESRLIRRRPMPRVGDLLRIPPSAVALMPKDDSPLITTTSNPSTSSTSTSTSSPSPALGEKRDREDINSDNTDEITKMRDFKIATVLGLVVVPQLRVVKPTISLYTRADPPRPADFADRWLVVRRVGEQLKKWKLPAELLLPKGTTTVNPDKKNNTKQDSDNNKKGSKGDKAHDAENGEAGRQGHAGRFKSFAEWIQTTFLPTTSPPSTAESVVVSSSSAAHSALQIADVAGGSGKLSAELSMYGHACCIVDPRILSNDHIISLQTQMRQRWLFRAHTKRHMDSLTPKHAANTLAATTTATTTTTTGGGTEVVKVPKKKPTEEEQFLTLNIPVPTPIRTLHCLCEFPRPVKSDGTEAPHADSLKGACGDDGGGGLDAVLRRSDLVVGLHCDGAVNGILYAATVYKKPFAIVPCCVFPSDFPRCLPPPPLTSSLATTTPSSSSVIPVISREELLDWIEAEARIIQYPGVVRRVVIPGLSGANVCIYGVPH